MATPLLSSIFFIFPILCNSTNSYSWYFVFFFVRNGSAAVILKMSFLGGAECSTAGNPLTQFTKHVQDDKSLQRDRLVGRGPGGMQEGMRSGGMMGGQDQVWQSPCQMSTSGNGKLTIGPVNAIFVFSN